ALNVGGHQEQHTSTVAVGQHVLYMYAAAVAGRCGREPQWATTPRALRWIAASMAPRPRSTYAGASMPARIAQQRRVASPAIAVVSCRLRRDWGDVWAATAGRVLASGEMGGRRSTG
ncbi:hypothetical protein FGB62_543g00, partial [Gracilaria domingensis]